ncbi:unnamed protein product [Acanthoscelides obtectus]|uniref:DUF7869 domain-containing protein n=1 Tax=Acanthoscelides obtectus TaxID=200917 RepID=A0A9P0MDC2_ACAOB|nr:unnamed protein product [Acanthoscelides obtectus]CAK1645807.1 hypothetical protein AOBTE_LOCUS14288 [Acanthoscelides obtectus]
MISSNESDDSAEGLHGSRKRKRNPKVWKDNKRKTAALKGEAYVSTSGKRVAPKSSGSPCGCKEKCTEKFPDEEKTILISKLYDDVEVCTFLKNYIETHIPGNVTELHIFSDGCPGQNRNNTIVRFFLALQATKRFKKIYHYFPVRGHSFLPCDRDFGTLKKLVRRSDRVYLPEEYQEMIVSCRKNNPFTFKEITYKDIIDFKNWWPSSYKKTASSIPKPGDTTQAFTVSKYRRFVYDSSSPGYVTTYEYIDGFISYTFKLLKQNKPSPPLPEIRAYQEPVSINHKKITDIKKVMKYIIGETLEFYYHVTSWKQSYANGDPVD